MSKKRYRHTLRGLSASPPATCDYRPERKMELPGPLDKTIAFLAGGFVRSAKAWKNRAFSIVPLVEKYAPESASLDEEGVKNLALTLRMELHQKGLERDTVARTFALIREISQRTLGLCHYPVQLMGGWAMLSGLVAEMNTGEGKTLTAILAAGTAALAGIPVHVISVNEYLTGRDAEFGEPVYWALGLTVGCVTEKSQPPERRAAYRCDITYCTNKDVVFDYLRDKMALKNRSNPLLLQGDRLCGAGSQIKGLLQRGLCYAIIDEADSVLIDEAKTPLVISGMTGGEEEELFLRQAMELAGTLKEGRDYHVDYTRRKIMLSDHGKFETERKSRSMGPLWKGTLRREEMICKALSANYLFTKDEHYLVDEGKVQIIDEFTGRVMADRSWEQGLHQLIEIKEGCDVTSRRETLARISYQRFFRRYLKLSGMTGTAKEVKGELWSVYRLPVVKIPPNRPVRREYLKEMVYPTADTKWSVVVERTLEMHRRGRPVLVGTRSVAESERLSALLSEKGEVPHKVLNARQSREEAEIIARAGVEGAVTIATNMAGRGTDIKLDEEARKKNGLHVILTERHEAGRIDRQLAGRCARQGDPGSFEAILSMEDQLIQHGTGPLKVMASLMMKLRLPGWRHMGKYAIVRAQKKTERLNARIRSQMLKQDENLGNMLSFSGYQE